VIVEEWDLNDIVDFPAFTTPPHLAVIGGNYQEARYFEQHVARPAGVRISQLTVTTVEKAAQQLRGRCGPTLRYALVGTWHRHPYGDVKRLLDNLTMIDAVEVTPAKVDVT
jgi:hypothetical protein